ncbi:DUF3179 domain-containing protein [Candidatus Chloroploca asiatica]|uniref:DUF3179 domain-containing protein n=1 Tax=Candidatus Chloroploca asiatica TaxID=1506545 RepID=A0A2H3KMS8_9CHLR|nr:DUF3179 domain-containing protein [Candidatus Chloroploca asiatica]PDV99371.1 hypothetical protein A9Q02_22160 [Candidatus Chloroploca asiatica]
MDRALLLVALVGIVLMGCGTATVAPSATLAPATPTPAPLATGSAPATGAAPSPVTPALLPEERLPDGAGEFTTDFSRHTVPYDEILSGGPPKDGIPAIDTPQFVSVAEADAWLAPQEPVVLVALGEDVRAYPLQVLMWHEIVNDTVGEQPVAVTFCPLCNTAIAFDRRVGEQVLDFGTTGRLRYSNLIMYDRQTESWWQQATGEAIAGTFAGSRLSFVPATIIAWEEFLTIYPEGRVLSRETGFSRNYGRNPYAGYDDVNRPPFLYDGPTTPDILPATARVLTVELAGEAVAYPYEVLSVARAVNDTVGNEPIVVLWQAGTASALDADSVAGGRDVGTAAAYHRVLDGQRLTFAFDGERLRDQETGSSWDVLGRAVDGPLGGAHLDPVVAVNHFWFSWAAFRPDTRIYR